MNAVEIAMEGKFLKGKPTSIKKPFAYKMQYIMTMTVQRVRKPSTHSTFQVNYRIEKGMIEI